MVVVPLLPVMLMSTISVLLLSYISLTVATMAAYPLQLLYRWQVFLVTHLSSWPGAGIATGSISIWVVVVWYVVLGAGFYGAMRWQDKNWRELWV